MFCCLRFPGQLVLDAKKSSKAACSLLCVLSFSLGNAQPLPSYLYAPEPLYAAQHLDRGGIVDWDTMTAPEVCASAVIQVLSKRITSDMQYMIR